MPLLFKTAFVKPLLKKSSLDSNILKHYRPVSNLNFISKLLEKVVSVQLQNHLSRNNIVTPLQSAYKKRHSTETALLRVFNDIVRFVDRGNCVLLILLDLSAAFDTIDHSILLSRLEARFGVTGSALEWLNAYLCNRIQYITIDGARSSASDLAFGVPQGSVLGPILYTLYTAPIADIISSYGLQYHLYADDTQLYIPITFSTAVESLTVIETCLAHIQSWMKINKLKLNNEKTEFILFSGQRSNTKDLEDSLFLQGSKIELSRAVRNLGFHFDTTLSFECHVGKICQSTHFHLRNIGKIRHLIDNDTCKLLVNSLITSRIDYCNSLLIGANAKCINRLQAIQNKAARLITKSRKYDHITPILRDLHWLPVKQRIEFKILLTTYNILNDNGPSYLKDLLECYEPSRTL